MDVATAENINPAIADSFVGEANNAPHHTASKVIA
jgi:hypothetical protein